ncbi:ABC transporter permease [Brooklawnia cerclae]|uniref:Transport permease protein n=1 Tax=Brooklawnia cerclae TaxID=349934 RepID=A0ABX0SM37_9ACTN|nr:ABC transporter permease [Brooklawnia cerclae]NIH57821.1 ABC-2 type transport system permease protein [Brooklawnia cerclae]
MSAIASPTTAPAEPSTVALGLSRAVFEIRGYFRRGDQMFFTFLFPIVMLAIFSTAFSGLDLGPDLTAASYYLPAMLAAGILTSGLQNLGIDIATERHDGTLKRLAGTPLSPASYFIGKIGQVLATGVTQAALLIAIGHVVFGVDLPDDAGRWLVFAWVLLLGLATSALIGIAIAQLPRSAKSAGAVITPVVLVLQFISGVYLQFSMLPEWLQNLASVFPLKWMAQGMRYVFLPDSLAAMEQGGNWNLTGVALSLAGWLVVGFVVARLTFRWIRKD